WLQAEAFEPIGASFSAPGWWSAVADEGPPAWYRWPKRRTELQLDDPTWNSTILVGYHPRPYVYAAWVILPVLSVVLPAGSVAGGMWVRRHRPEWYAALAAHARAVRDRALGVARRA